MGAKCVTFSLEVTKWDHLLWQAMSTSLYFSNSLWRWKAKGANLQDQAAATDDFSPKELSAAFPAPPAALPIVTRAITTHLRARGREAY